MLPATFLQLTLAERPVTPLSSTAVALQPSHYKEWTMCSVEYG